nr:hypothetical protein [Tanacetum cinerariifolium]
MKSSQMLMLFGFFFLCFLQIPSSDASFNKENPMYNVNLAPFIQRLSAYYCLKKVSPDCPGNLTLSTDGWLNVSSSETQQFCQGAWFVAWDLQDFTQTIHFLLMHIDNKATIQNIKDTINNGCTQGFTGISLYKGSGSSTTTSIVTSLSALVFLALFYM